MVNLKREEKFDKLCAEHPSLKEAFQNEASVYAWFMQYLNDRCTLEEAYIGSIVYLSRESKHNFDELIKMKQRYGNDRLS